jgi:hypothetical protein
MHRHCQGDVSVIARAKGEICCPEKVEGEAFNIGSEQPPTQRDLYNLIAEPIRVPYVETREVKTNKSIVLYPDVLRGPISSAKAMDVLRWSPTDLSKAIRSVALFYDRVMLDNTKYKKENAMMFDKVKRMLGKDGPRFIQFINKYYDEKRKTELYDELDDEDEDDILLSMSEEKKKTGKRRRKAKKGTEL